MGDWTFLQYIYNRFPRKFLLKYQIPVNSFEELERMLKLHYKNGRCGVTIYNTPEDGRADLDRIVFDLDTPGRALEDVKKLHRHFREYTHFVVFSGKGFHFYLFTENYKHIKDQKATLRNAYESIEREVGIVCDPSLVTNALSHPLGVPTTFNSREGRRKYLIFVSEDDLALGYEHILAMADTPNHPFVVYGQDFLDLGKYNATSKPYVPPVINTIPEGNLPKIDEDWFMQLPTWVQAVLTKPAKIGHRSRFFVCAWLRAEGYPEAFTDAVAKEFWGRIPHREAGTQYDRVRQKKTIEAAYRGKPYTPPSGETLRKEGLMD